MVTKETTIAERPWRISEFEARAGGQSRMVMAADGYAVAWVSERMPAENDANADLIVRAVNAHDDLVKACEAVVAAGQDARGCHRCGRWGDLPHAATCEVNLAEQAILKAIGRT